MGPIQQRAGSNNTLLPFFLFFFFCGSWVVGCGGWLFWQLVWCFNGGQDWSMGFVGCWVKGLWLTGNLLVAWYAWVLRDGFLMWFGRDVVKGFWRWCGGWISGGGKYMVKVFFFFFFLLLSGSGLNCDDASNGLVFALIPKLTQDNQNKTETTEK